MESPLIPKEGIFLATNPLRRAAALLSLLRLLGLMVSSVLLVDSDGDTKQPIVLDARHTFVKLFLRHSRLKNHHQGIDYLRSKIPERYAILKQRSTLRSIKSNCVLCRMFRAATIQPIMAELPKEILTYPSPPFNNTGIDYLGPFYVTVGRTTEKKWGFLFTCLTTRAFHVENFPVHGH